MPGRISFQELTSVVKQIGARLGYEVETELNFHRREYTVLVWLSTEKKDDEPVTVIFTQRDMLLLNSPYLPGEFLARLQEAMDQKAAELARTEAESPVVLSRFRHIKPAKGK